LAQTLGFIGGTGPEGRGLALRFAKEGVEVFIGSRSQERGETAGRELRELSGGKVKGGTNAEAAKADLIIVTTPYVGMREAVLPLAAAIGEQIVVSTVVPLHFEGGRVGMLQTEMGSAAEDLQLYLPRALVVGAFQNLSAHKLSQLDERLEGDVIVTSDHIAALREVMYLAETIPGIRGVNGGPLSNSVYVEGITALLVSVNRIHKAESHVKILGI
jgi:hypothetical protein